MSDKTVARMTQAGVWLPLSGRFNPAELFEEGRAGIGDITLPGAGARTIIYRADSRGLPVPTAVTRAAPGQPTATLQNFLGFARDWLQRSRAEGSCAYVQVRLHQCTDMDHPGGWDTTIHLGRTLFGDETIGSPVARVFTDEEITKEVPAQPIYDVVLARPALTAQTFAGAQNLSGVVFVDDPESCEGCEESYPGPHKVGFITEEAPGAGTASIYYTKNGGTWATTSADPFTTDEDAKFPVIRSLNKTQWRLIVGRTTTDAGNPAEIAYSNVTKGIEETTVWTAVNVGATNGDVINSIFWPKFQQLFVGFGGGDIAFSDDQGATFTVEFTGSNAINQLTKRFIGGDVYAVGATNTILRRAAGGTTWSALTGPTGTNASTAIAIASDGTIWLGNGTSLFRSSTPLPTNTSHWTSVKDFGTNHSVIGIRVLGGKRAFGGDSQLLHLVVQDATGTNGDLWLSIDGGGYIEEITDLSNAGYNAAWFSSLDDNIGWIVGNASGGAGVVHKFAPALGV